MRPSVHTFFDERTFTATYVVSDPATRVAAIIDSVLDFDPKSGRTWTESVDRVAAYVQEKDLRPEWVLETHVHADHLTAAPTIKARLGGRIAIGADVVRVQKTFAPLFNFESSFRSDGSQFDKLFKDGERVPLGELEIEVMHTPGHTPACVSYLIGDAVFVGDTIFMPDFGSARCDFPGGDARELYASIRRLLDLPPETRIFVGHDYGTGGREFAWESSVAEQRARNKHVREGVGEDDFVAMRTARDKELDFPNLILPSVQVNIRAGAMPPPEANGISYLKIPVNGV